MNKKNAHTRCSTSKRRRLAPRFVRIVFRVLIAACIVLVGGAIISKAARPYLISYTEAQEIRQLEEQIGQIEAENEAIKRNIEYLQTPQGMEVGARRLGWVKEKEIVVVIEEAEEGARDEQDEHGAAEPLNRIEDWIKSFIAPKHTD